jgi:hypothetical protein
MKTYNERRRASPSEICHIKAVAHLLKGKLSSLGRATPCLVVLMLSTQPSRTGL